MDCVTVTGNTSGHHYSGQDEIDSLAIFGGRYREFCRHNGFPIVSTRGKIGGAFLRDPRFFGDGQRKIPAFINETAREHLPGNHYELRGPENTPLSGVYLDITGAHHTAAIATKFPDPSGLRARGKHRSPPESAYVGEPWAKPDTPKGKAILRTHGMVLLQCDYRGTSKGAIVHPAAWEASTNRPNYIYAYTNELELLKESGFTISGIEAAWTSGRTSDSLNRYGAYALESLAKTPKEDRPWVKQLYLSTYGMLGKKPSKYQSVSNMGGKVYNWPTPSGWIEAGIKETSKPYVSSTGNVIALGMIQAETRRNVISLARHLQSYGVTILALYADSLIVDPGENALPFLPPEWRVKTNLTNLIFLNRVSFISDEEERLPGISREEHLRNSRRNSLITKWRAQQVTHTYGPHGEGPLTSTGPSDNARPPARVMAEFERLENR